ncbi:MAG: hypothetical protein ACI8O8_000474 [Oleiphilaceae bacterium]|jgi:hypothetical protein
MGTSMLHEDLLFASPKSPERDENMEEKDINRLLLHYQQLVRTANKVIINPEIEELNINDLKPMIELVAKSRGSYLKYSYEIGKQYFNSDDLPTSDELKKLRTLRLRFTELSESAQAFETCIRRGYLDLKLDKG